jgi:IS605 OrfB family transposase
LKLTAKIRLNSDASQRKALLDTIEQANACCDWISEQAWERKVFAQFALHRLLYHAARERFPLSAQVVVRVFAKVADAYKLDKKTQRRFAKHGAISYDSRILSFKPETVSIWTTAGRLKIGYSSGERQKELLKSQQGESDLIYHRGKFYLASTCDVPDPSPSVVDDFLGIDLGVTNIATSSDGDNFSGSMVKSVRYRHRRLRTRLQKKQTRSAIRRLRQLSRKERRFATDVNHCISKQIVAIAKGTERGLAIEELTGIRERITADRKQRAVLHSWAFFQLRAFLTYKAALAGVPLIAVDPRNSSRECSECGYTDKKNRPNQSTFRCLSCGHTANADFNAAVNLQERGRAARQAAERSELCSVSHDLVTSRLL